ncbi:MAG TPA: KpsF/GutQ family sugar-phosphate isomerase [Rhizobiales bacterium]|nr:KpsF/GutQ family sugar-phosphate isomerase [Hyphomicrobiales bacterium]
MHPEINYKMTSTPEHLIKSAKATLRSEVKGLDALTRSLDDKLGQAFYKTIDLMSRVEGRIILTGIGKSGHIGRKIAATLASTGTPAYFVHAAEASHGDLGMFTSDDIILALSWSGETLELKDMIEFSRRHKVTLIAMTANQNSALGKAADILLPLPAAEEACPNGLAPTTSTTMQLALGDALALALLEHRGFTASDFRKFHPGGKLGASLSYIRDLMHEGDEIPLCGLDETMSQALLIMSEKSFGCLGITAENGTLAGIITDGDLRREMSPHLLEQRTRDIMTLSPKTISPDMLASKALEMINRSSITSLFVVDKGRPVGIVHIHDLLRAGVA